MIVGNPYIIQPSGERSLAYSQMSQNVMSNMEQGGSGLSQMTSASQMS